MVFYTDFKIPVGARIQIKSSFLKEILDLTDNIILRGELSKNFLIGDIVHTECTGVIIGMPAKVSDTLLRIMQKHSKLNELTYF